MNDKTNNAAACDQDGRGWDGSVVACRHCWSFNLSDASTKGGEGKICNDCGKFRFKSPNTGASVAPTYGPEDMQAAWQSGYNTHAMGGRVGGEDAAPPKLRNPNWTCCPVTPLELIGACPSVAFKAGWDAAVAAADPLAVAERLLRALSEYPAKNPQQMQARKVCAGVLKLADGMQS